MNMPWFLMMKMKKDPRNASGQPEVNLGRESPVRLIQDLLLPTTNQTPCQLENVRLPTIHQGIRIPMFPGQKFLRQHVHRPNVGKLCFEEAQTFAPRVGNTRCPADSTAWSRAQATLETSMKITDMFVCRGTERFQVPLQAPASHQFPLRYTCVFAP